MIWFYESLVQELMRVMYTDPDTSCLKDVSNTPGKYCIITSKVWLEWSSLHVPFLGDHAGSWWLPVNWWWLWQYTYCHNHPILVLSHDSPVTWLSCHMTLLSHDSHTSYHITLVLSYELSHDSQVMQVRWRTQPVEWDPSGSIPMVSTLQWGTEPAISSEQEAILCCVAMTVRVVGIN